MFFPLFKVHNFNTCSWRRINTCLPPSRKLQTLSSLLDTKWNVSRIICCCMSSACNTRDTVQHSLGNVVWVCFMGQPPRHKPRLMLPVFIWTFIGWLSIKSLCRRDIYLERLRTYENAKNDHHAVKPDHSMVAPLLHSTVGRMFGGFRPCSLALLSTTSPNLCILSDCYCSMSPLWLVWGVTASSFFFTSQIFGL